MEPKIALADLLKIKQSVDQMDLLEFKTQWSNRSHDYVNLDQAERLKYMVMSIKILQAKADLKRMINSIQELSAHPESERAIYYYLRADLWKFLDNFHYLLFVEEENEEKFACLDLLDQMTEIIGQDDELQQTCTIRLHKLFEQTRLLKQEAATQQPGSESFRTYHQIEQRLAQILQTLDPSMAMPTPLPEDLIPPIAWELIQKYTAFSISRISIEKSGVLSIIQLLCEYPLPQLSAHQAELEKMLNTVERRALYEPQLATMRNQCGFALILLLEIVKMHEGLPVLLSRIFDLCSYVYFPQQGVSLEKELKELKGRVAEISQKKLRPIIEDVLWKNPTYLTKVAYIRKSCGWCYRDDRRDALNLSFIRQVITSSFDRLESVPALQFSYEGVAKSHLSEMVIESLGLLVNLEPSPQFLTLHAKETRMIKQAQKAGTLTDNAHERLLNKQYQTYKNHLKFLRDSIEYYHGISEEPNPQTEA